MAFRKELVEKLLDKSVMLPSNLLRQIEAFIKENEQAGFESREAFIEDAMRFRLASLKK